MAVNLTALLPAKNKVAQPDPFLWLIFARVPTDPETAIRITPNPEPVRFGTTSDGSAITWTPFPVVISEIEEDTEGNLPELTLTVSNVTREIMALLIAHDYLLDQEVELLLVHKNHLGNPNAALRYRYAVVETQADTEAVSFSLSTRNLYRFEIPVNRIIRDFCGWTYRAARGCGFAGDPGNTLGDCGKTYPDCQLREAWQVANGEEGDQTRRFGGFLGVPVA